MTYNITTFDLGYDMPTMAASLSSLLLPLGSTCKSLGCNPQGIAADRLRCLVLQYQRSVVKEKASDTTECAMVNSSSRRDFLGLALGVSSLFVGSLEGKGAGLPPEDKPKLCDEACEKELENAAEAWIDVERVYTIALGAKKN
ncbi:peptidyl-prolyl cis-trans isomerase FKBP16-3, chloroplastic isoform X1 [Arachis hypogaea]|uniref:peptidyl-prolyl cis-trans isomerase FKBP16-3, chloroplastic isoform X1 n=1 Tax=Arachis hypogaea TaxID=3818 RepID=UPI000DEC533A|nr:peptidyl-prolyl cis-trans isomerase FKBP16-3, chloroplastic isoform X1 [Arachis hypogaea]